MRSGQEADAELQLRQSLLADPANPSALAMLADLVIAQGRFADGAALLRRRLAASPGDGPTRFRLADVLHRSGDNAGALDEIGRLPAAGRADSGVKAFEAAILGLLGQHDRELALYGELVRASPRDAPLWMSFGNALKTVGRTDEAVRALRRAIRAQPTFGEAYWSLANLKTFAFDKRDLLAMERALADPAATPDDRLHLHFALGKALEDRGEFERGFNHYTAGNALRASAFPPGAMSATERVDRSIAAFTPALFDRFAGAGCDDPAPIFIVGLQRSGSTLIEQILASHPAIEGTAELTEMEQLWVSAGQLGKRSGDPFGEIANLTPADVQRLGEDYVERTRVYRSTGRPMFIDKLPGNWLNAGFIRLILPNAKIIDARRHPMACGLSNFRQHYASGVSFAYDQHAIGQFYRDYLRLMDHLDRVQPGAVHHVLNERLIDAPEATVRALLGFLGLPFDPACLDFHRNPRAVRSPSAEQVRRPINRDGVDSWRSFEPWLGPMKAAMGDALDRWDRNA